MDFLLLLLYCCFSRTAPVFQTDEPKPTSIVTTRTIDLDQARKNPENLTTDAIARSFEYVALETTDDCLVSGWAASYVFAKHIVMESPLDAPLLFDRQGKFLTRIGHRGHGPGEFTEPIHSVFVDAEADRITLFFMRKAMHFDLRGKFIQEEKLWLNPLLNAAGLTQENRQMKEMKIAWGGNNRQVAVLLGLSDSCLILTASAANRPFTKIEGKYKMRRIYYRSPNQSYAILYPYKTDFTQPDYFKYYDGTANFYRIYYNGTVEHPFHIRNSAVSQLGEPVTIEFFVEANDYLFLGTSLARSSALSKPEIPYYVYLPAQDRAVNLSEEKLNPGTAYGIAFWPFKGIPAERAVFEKVEAIDFKRRAEASNDEQAKVLSRKLKDDDNPVIVIARLK